MSSNHFFTSLIFLDFPHTPQTLTRKHSLSGSLGYAEYYEQGAESHLHCFSHFINTLLQTKLNGHNGWSIIGIPFFPFQNDDVIATNYLKPIHSFFFKTTEVMNLLKKKGFKRGFHDFINDLFKKNQQRFSIIFGFSVDKENYPLFDHYFYQKLTHDLHSQPIWFLNKNWIEDIENDTRYLIFSVLADSYDFISFFPFIVYDENGWIDYLLLNRKNIEDKDLFDQHFNTYLKNPISNQDTGTWTEKWGTQQIEELYQSIEMSRQFKLKISPIKFKHNLLDKAREVKKKILLVEGHDPRILKAVDKAVKLGIRGLAVMGKKDEIKSLANQHHLNILSEIEIIEPADYQQTYTISVHDRLKKKAISMEEAYDLIKDDLVLAGILLHEGVVDGVVAGAHYSTADTLKAAIRMVGLEPGHNIVSSFFFILLPQDVILFADCAVNPSPNPEQLSDITIQSIHSGHRFFNRPIHASVISFSTMGSAKTPEVERIEQTMEIIQGRMKTLNLPSTLIEGPVQYDTATNYDISKKKFPESKILGKSNVIIFPNLETGNTVYKAVKQSLIHKECHCIGPILQGLRKPYNDLSRGSTVEDIFQTLLITIIQSQSN